jgi:anti-sigma factor RsiW
MHDHDRLLQRLHDGELSRAEAAGLQHLLAGRPDLQAASSRFDALDGLLKDHAAVSRVSDVSALEARIRQALPTTPPKREVQISAAHLVTAVVLVSFVALAVMVANQLSEVMRDVVPVWSLAVISAACGLSLLIAARPLLRLEMGMINRLLRRRLSVGDGEVLVCRVLGVALIVGGAHIAGLWG